jgi:hypothetical protein
MPVSATLTILIAPVIIDAAGWRGLWLAVAAGCLVCLIPVLRVLDLSPPARPTSPRFFLAARLLGVLGIPGI